MKKLQRSFWRRYRAITLYRDDVERIHKALMKVYKRVELVADDHLLDGVAEFEKLGRSRVDELCITAWTETDTGYASDIASSLRVNWGDAALYVADDDDTVARGVAAQIDEILSSCVGRLESFVARISIAARCRVYTTARESRSSFLQRNKDKLLLAIISAALGGAITLLATGLVRWLWGESGG